MEGKRKGWCVRARFVGVGGLGCSAITISKERCRANKLVERNNRNATGVFRNEDVLRSLIES